MQYVKKKDRLTLSKFLDQKDISKGQFLLKTEAKNGHDVEIIFQVNKNGDADVSSHPFLMNLPQNQADGSRLIEENLKSEIQRLQTKVQRLETNRDDADERRKEAENELFRIQQSQSTGQNQTLLAHQQELAALKETHRDEKDELKEKLSELKTEMKIKELSGSGETSWGDRFLNIVEENLSNDSIGRLIKNLQERVQPQPPQLTQVQQQAVQQAREWQQAQQEGNNDGPEADEVNENPASDLQPQPDSSQRAAAQPNQDPMKQHIINGLQNLALETLTADHPNLKQYTAAVQNQLAINKQQGIQLDAGQWVQMAKMLAEKAVKEQISPRKVASVIDPALEGIPMTYRMMLKALDPSAAADQLFRMFNIQAAPPVKQVVVNVLKVIKNQ
jgi:hypothetical protein